MILNISLKIKPSYTCLKCGRKQIGTDTDTYTSTGINSIVELTNIITKYETAPPIQGIPIGWSSAGCGRVYCENCK